MIATARDTFGATVDLAELEALVAAGYLASQTHPSGELRIWNYTAKTQYERHWTPATLQCRGLITDREGRIVARPFPKFFNLSEHEGPLPGSPFDVYEKLDGSLGILYWHDGQPAIATRGSFTSPQAIKATEILRRRYGNTQLWPDLTYLFEVIYPGNRIVVDYGDREDLVLIGVIRTESGQEYDPEFYPPFTIPRRYPWGSRDLAWLAKREIPNHEGFVVRFAGGLRLKVKLAEYVRLHRLLTGVSAVSIWNCLRQGDALDAFLANVPDEFYDWITDTRDRLLSQYVAIEIEAARVYREVCDLPTRKEQAAIVTRSRYPGVVFAMLDARDYRDAIWRLVRPTSARPYWNDAE